MTDAPVPSRFGALPASDAETNGDYLQALVRLATMTGDQRFLDWARRIGDAYVEEVLPGSGGVPGYKWDFQTHSGERRLRLRDHGNETIVGLVMLFALEHQLGSPRAASYRPGDPAHAGSGAGVGQSRRPALQRGERRHAAAARSQPVRQLGLRLRRGLHLLHGHRRDPLPGRGPPRAARSAEISQVRLGAAQRSRRCRSVRSTDTPTPSRAPSTSSRASPCRKRSTGSNRRWT